MSQNVPECDLRSRIVAHAKLSSKSPLRHGGGGDVPGQHRHPAAQVAERELHQPCICLGHRKGGREGGGGGG